MTKSNTETLKRQIQKQKGKKTAKLSCQNSSQVLISMVTKTNIEIREKNAKTKRA